MGPAVGSRSSGRRLGMASKWEYNGSVILTDSLVAKVQPGPEWGDQSRETAKKQSHSQVRDAGLKTQQIRGHSGGGPSQPPFPVLTPNTLDLGWLMTYFHPQKVAEVTLGQFWACVLRRLGSICLHLQGKLPL
jgi:hypothetical protein